MGKSRLTGLCWRKCGGIALVQAGGCVVLSVVGHMRALPLNLLSVEGSTSTHLVRGSRGSQLQVSNSSGW